jgi:hypothetical protein
MGCVILSTLVAPLVSGIRPPMQRGLLELAAGLVAVALAPVIRPTDVEPPATSGATQLEDNEPVHPARKDENWTATSATITVRRYWLSIRRRYMRVQLVTGPSFVSSAAWAYSNRAGRANSLHGSDENPRSWSPVTGPLRARRDRRSHPALAG